MGAHEQGIDVTSRRWTTIPRTLSFVTNDGDVLLMQRSLRTRIFPGRYNGIGGHLERGEDPLTGALREIGEETGLIVRDVRLRGLCNVDAGQDVGVLLFVFTARADSRQTVECAEGTLHWVPIAAAYSLPLVEDLSILLPRLFGSGASDSPFFAHVRYDPADQMIMTFASQG
jgi:8-oxo-dGTP diphosphatase